MSFKIGKGQTEGLFIQSTFLQIKAKEVSQGETGGERKEENGGRRCELGGGRLEGWERRRRCANCGWQWC